MQPSKRRILCADDDSYTNEILTYWLSLEGFDVKTAETLEGTLNLARQEAFDLYLLDDWFPDGRGHELIQEIRRFDPCTPIVVFSGDVRHENQEKLLRLGAQAFLPKPTPPSEVTKTIEHLLHVQEEGSSALSTSIPTSYQ